MPGIPTLQPEDASLGTLRKHWIFLRVGVESEPLAAALLPELVAFGSRFDTVAAEAQRLGDAVLLARTKAVAADHVLNRLADQVSSAIHDGKKPDLDLPLHQLYFGRKRPSEVKRPILGAQLEVMRAWPGLLALATQPALLSLAPAVAAGVEAAEGAAKRLSAALAAEDAFKFDGARKELFAVYNALAARTFGSLKGIGHNHAELGLSPDWAESFFLHESHGKETETVASVSAELARLERAAEAARRRLAELEAEAREAEAARAADAAAREALAAAKRESAAAKQREREAMAAAKKAKRSLR